MAEEQVVISVADDQVGDMRSVVEALRHAGLRVSEVLTSVGVVAGTVSVLVNGIRASRRHQTPCRAPEACRKVTHVVDALGHLEPRARQRRRPVGPAANGTRLPAFPASCNSRDVSATNGLIRSAYFR